MWETQKKKDKPQHQSCIMMWAKSSIPIIRIAAWCEKHKRKKTSPNIRAASWCEQNHHFPSSALLHEEIKLLGKDLDIIACTLYAHFFLGVCTPCADIFCVHTHFFQTLKKPPFSPSCTGSFEIPVSWIGLITSPTSLDRNSKVLFSVVLKGLKSLHSLHGVHEVCMGLPPDEAVA